jgi:hypothetical protein
MLQQIQSRFRFFQFFWLLQVIASPIILLTSELVNPNSESVKASISQYSLFYFFGYLGMLVIITAISITATVFYSMLTHGIYNYLKINKDSEVNPTWAVWSIFIPFASSILTALNTKKAYESLQLTSKTAKNFFYFAIFNTIIIPIVIFGSLFYSVYERIQNGVKLETVKPFMNINFYTNVVSILVSLVLAWFVWRIMKEMTSAIISQEV